MRKSKDNLLDEAALLGSGVGIAYSASQYARLRKELSKKYTQNAWKVTGRPFSKKGYEKWMTSYLANINKLRNSPKTHLKGKGIFTDLKHFDPTNISSASKKLIPKNRINTVISMNKKVFRKVAPKRVSLFAAGLATAATLPALAYKAQGKKDWKKSIKDSSLQIAGPTLAVLGAYGYYKLGGRGKTYAKITNKFLKRRR